MHKRKQSRFLLSLITIQVEFQRQRQSVSEVMFDGAPVSGTADCTMARVGSQLIS